MVRSNASSRAEDEEGRGRLVRQARRSALLLSLLVMVGASSLLGGGAVAADESVNAGTLPISSLQKPFDTVAVATFDEPWALAFLPDGRMLVTERGGRLLLVDQDGGKRVVSGVPAVASGVQNGLLDIVVPHDFERERMVYLTYSEPARGLALARARLVDAADTLHLDRFEVIWRQSTDRNGSFWGGVVALDPDGDHLFLAVRDSARLSTDPSGAQDPNRDLGKVLRLRLDGTAPADNPFGSAKDIRAEVWTLGHRTAYGLAFAPDGQLWQHEMGPEGGDEFNRLTAGGNYGWPLVSNGRDYGGSPIPEPATRPDFRPPSLYWSPVIAPAGLAFYTGDMFPEWREAALITGLRGESLVLVSVDPDGHARQTARWDMGGRMRDVAIAPDGAVWLIEDGPDGRLHRLSRPDR